MCLNFGQLRLKLRDLLIADFQLALSLLHLGRYQIQPVAQFLIFQGDAVALFFTGGKLILEFGCLPIATGASTRNARCTGNDPKFSVLGGGSTGCSARTCGRVDLSTELRRPTRIGERRRVRDAQAFATAIGLPGRIVLGDLGNRLILTE